MPVKIDTGPIIHGNIVYIFVEIFFTSISFFKMSFKVRNFGVSPAKAAYNTASLTIAES